MSHNDIEHAIRRYARTHRFDVRTVRSTPVLRFAALRSWKAETLFRQAQHVA